MLAFTLFAIGYVAIDWWLARRSGDTPLSLRWTAWSLGGAAVIVSLLATVWVWRTGHSGAESVWHDTKVVTVEREDR